MLVEYRLCRCSVVIEMLLLASYRLCGCIFALISKCYHYCSLTFEVEEVRLLITPERQFNFPNEKQLLVRGRALTVR